MCGGCVNLVYALVLEPLEQLRSELSRFEPMIITVSRSTDTFVLYTYTAKQKFYVKSLAFVDIS